ncbi:8536_t:CDS:1, partial [Gigaspora margarita]
KENIDFDKRQIPTTRKKNILIPHTCKRSPNDNIRKCTKNNNTNNANDANDVKDTNNTNNTNNVNNTNNYQKKH